jgi:hypothetical protein
MIFTLVALGSEELESSKKIRNWFLIFYAASGLRRHFALSQSFVIFKQVARRLRKKNCALTVNPGQWHNFLYAVFFGEQVHYPIIGLFCSNGGIYATHVA